MFFQRCDNNVHNVVTSIEEPAYSVLFPFHRESLGRWRKDECHHHHSFNGQKGKTSLDFTRARDSEWQWHQLGHIQICTFRPCPRQISMLAPHHSVFTSRMPFLPPNQQHQSTEAKKGSKDEASSNLYSLVAVSALSSPEYFDAVGYTTGRASNLIQKKASVSYSQNYVSGNSS